MAGPVRRHAIWALRLVAAAALVIITSSSLHLAHADKPVSDKAVPVTVAARQIVHFAPGQPERSRFGRLVFRGGLVLTSPDKDFGGLSGLALDATGEQFIAISDHGDWFTGKLRYHGEAPAALENVTSGPLVGADGRTLAAKRWYDTESLALDGMMAYVGIERVHQIVRMDLSKGILRARAESLPVPDGLRRLPSNKGTEGLVFVPKERTLGGALIAFSERGLDEAGNIKAFVIGGPRPGTFAVKRSNDFDISDAALVPGGDVLILERKFSILTGVAIRIRAITLDAIAAGSTVDGPAIFEADMANDIDNLEAMAVHRTDIGDTVLTLVSDDNFSPIQRTILLQFTLTGPD